MSVYGRIVMMVLVGLFVTGTLSFAQDMDGSDAAMMAGHDDETMMRMQEYGTPNENHAVLARLAGSWNADVTFWMAPDGEPQTSQSTGEAEMIFGGRFLEQKFSGLMMGQPFEGRGIYGYDNITEEYNGIWFDNFGTGIMVSKSQYDPQTKTLQEEGSMSCPLTNDKRSYRAVTTIVDDDHYTYETFMTDPQTGEEYRSMRIEYSRM